MISLFSNFKMFRKKEEGLKVNLTPFYFTELAISKIKAHIENRPASIKSAFKIEVLYLEDRVNYRVGYDDSEAVRKTNRKYPVPVIISERDEKYLQGSYIDYHEEDKSFFVYPDIQLIAENTPDKNIIRFFVNRNVISPSSKLKSFAIDSKSMHLVGNLNLFNKLFATGKITSIYCEDNRISVEKNKGENPDQFEKLIADIILDYFEKCGYPFLVSEDSIEAEKYE